MIVSYCNSLKKKMVEQNKTNKIHSLIGNFVKRTTDK